MERPNVRPFSFCSTDTSRWHSARLWLHLVRRASPNKGGSSTWDMGACSLLPLVCPSLSCNSHAPYRSVDYNRVQNRKTNSKFPQETFADVASPEWGSLKDRDKDTVDGYRAAFSSSLWTLLTPQDKVGSSNFARSRSKNARHGLMLKRLSDGTPYSHQLTQLSKVSLLISPLLIRVSGWPG